jgi:hypothetical protein
MTCTRPTPLLTRRQECPRLRDDRVTDCVRDPILGRVGAPGNDQSIRWVAPMSLTLATALVLAHPFNLRHVLEGVESVLDAHTSGTPFRFRHVRASVPEVHALIQAVRVARLLRGLARRRRICASRLRAACPWWWLQALRGLLGSYRPSRTWCASGPAGCRQPRRRE